MCGFGLKTAEIWVRMALLLLCFSICPYSGYPDAQEDEDLTEAEDNMDTEDAHESGEDNDEPTEEEHKLEESTIQGWKDDKRCKQKRERCDNHDQCCFGMTCFRRIRVGDWFKKCHYGDS